MQPRMKMAEQTKTFESTMCNAFVAFSAYELHVAVPVEIQSAFLFLSTAEKEFEHNFPIPNITSFLCRYVGVRACVVRIQLVEFVLIVSVFIHFAECEQSGLQDAFQ